MDATDLARIQFASTSISHFFFVPVTIGLAFLMAILHTKWYRSGEIRHERLTRFFGTLLLINVAIGVVTGLVQEFQFGMNWSAYSLYVGDVFGAPLAMEGLAAFFLESTFLGLWVFGWRVLPRRIHLLSAWLVAAGAMLSAAFIMAANAWMQHPVGYTTDPDTGRPVLNSIRELFTNPVFIWGYIHVILAALVTGAVVMLAVSAWQLRRGNRTFKTSALLSLVVLLPASLLQLGVGSQLGVIETTYQPMKIAAAEAQWETCQPCSFSLLQIGGFESSDEEPIKIIAGSTPAVDSGHSHVGRRGRGAQRTAEPIRGRVRPGRLRAAGAHPVLVDAGDGLSRHAGLPVLAVGHLARGTQKAADVPRLPRPRDLGRPGAAHHEHGRMVPDRERSTTMDRAGADEDRGRRLGDGVAHRDHPEPRRVLRGVPAS